MGAINDRFNAMAAWRLRRMGRPPETIERAYWDAANFARDHERLAALGYFVSDESANDPVMAATLPAAVGGVMGHTDIRIERRIPSIHVVYVRRPARPAE